MNKPRPLPVRALAAFTVLFIVIVPLLAAIVNVDDEDVFEMDGNPQNDAPAGEDWQTYFNVPNPTPPFPAGAALQKTFVAETGNTTIFTQGGSKDVNGVGQWRHTNGSVPDKDDLQNGFAAAYNVVSGTDNNLIIYFGADRTANNGDANIGFWFFQSNVSLAADGTFTGRHQDGDIFVVSGFTSGGQTSEIDVFKWSCPGNPANCDDVGSLQLITSSSAAQCASSAAGTKVACAISNTGNVTALWSYTPKQGAGGTYPVASFFEGGINVTALIPGSPQCFSSFIVETRSSTSTTAQLKDLIRGDFTLCGLSITKTCPADGTVNSGGGSIHYTYTGTVTNTGVGALSNVTLVDTLPSGTLAGSVIVKAGTPLAPVSTGACPAGSPAGAVCANLGALAGGGAVNYSIEFDSTNTGPQNNAYATASFSGTTISSTSKNATCSVTASNDVSVTKNCGIPVGYPNNPAGGGAVDIPGTQLVTDSGKAVVQVNFSGEVCNEGQTKLTGITLADNPDTTVTITWPGTAGELLPPVSPATKVCAKFSGSYKPTGATGLGLVGGRYAFEDEIKVTGASVAFGTPIAADATCISTFSSGAQACQLRACNICPGTNGGALCNGQ